MKILTKKSSGEIPIFWYSMPILHGHEKENFGDMLSKYIVEKIFGINVVHENPLNSKWYKPILWNLISENIPQILRQKLLIKSK